MSSEPAAGKYSYTPAPRPARRVAQLHSRGHTRNMTSSRQPPPPRWPATAVVLSLLVASCSGGSALSLAPLFGEGMILQRAEAGGDGGGTAVWGSGATPHTSVIVTIAVTGGTTTRATAPAAADGNWTVLLPGLVAAAHARLDVSDGASTFALSDVAIGDVILCGGQSNMGFGMCRSASRTQTPQQALDGLPPMRIFRWYGSGPGSNGGCNTSAGGRSVTPNKQWLLSNASNAGGFSAVCLLTAQRLYEAAPHIPIGAVESCVSGTSVERCKCNNAVSLATVSLCL